MIDEYTTVRRKRCVPEMLLIAINSGSKAGCSVKAFIHFFDLEMCKCFVFKSVRIRIIPTDKGRIGSGRFNGSKYIIRCFFQMNPCIPGRIANGFRSIYLFFQIWLKAIGRGSKTGNPAFSIYGGASTVNAIDQ